MHELADGRLVATERDGHPDSIAEAFRRRITVLELQQIIGRGRGLWRTADNPLHVLVLTDVALDMPVEERHRRPRNGRASRIGRLRSAPSPSRHPVCCACRCCRRAYCARSASLPHFWKGLRRVCRALGRGQPAGTIAWQYRIAGQGERPWRVYAPPSIHNQQAPRSNLLTRS